MVTARGRTLCVTDFLEGGSAGYVCAPGDRDDVVFVDAWMIDALLISLKFIFSLSDSVPKNSVRRVGQGEDYTSRLGYCIGGMLGLNLIQLKAFFICQI
jgi:hypothetical protein